MGSRSLSQLEVNVETLTTNGKLSQAQAAIAGVGYDVPALDTGGAKLSTVRAQRSDMQRLIAEQKSATQAEAAARKVAHREATSLGDTCRKLFKQNDVALTALALNTQYETVPADGSSDGAGNGEGATKTQAVSPSKATTEVLARWRNLFTDALSLSPDRLELLYRSGWKADRLAGGQQLVETYASADFAQQQAVQAYLAASAALDGNEEDLRKWYSLASGLCRRAILDVDPQDRGQLGKLLGLREVRAQVVVAGYCQKTPTPRLCDEPAIAH